MRVWDTVTQAALSDAWHMGECRVKTSRRLRRVVGGCLLLLWCSACTGVRDLPDKPSHFFDKTEVDLEYGRPEAADRYRRLQGVPRSPTDGTEIDLPVSKAPLPESNR